ncbi:MAG: phosphodiester glycosidase family protein [Anaerolineae bacterium]|nr:phosphodiester glycosidase family protein [Anaerolineae bacterium]
MMMGCTLSSLGTPMPSPTATPLPSGDWEILAPGLERRAYSPPNNNFGALIALRIDPTLYTLRAHYQPGSPLTVDEWRNTLPGAAAFINANFFDPQHVALGLVIADGIAYGQSFADRGGMLQVQNGMPRVRSLLSEPYFVEPLEQAVQAFPMLVTGGQVAFNNTSGDRVSRRTVAAQDTQGRIILLATPLLGITLTDLAAYLPTTDMEIINAVNLDGGGSTMMYIGPGSTPYTLASFDPVPVVLAVYPR